MGLEYTDITKAEKEKQWLRSDRIKLKKEDHPMKRTLAILLALVLALSVCSFAAAEDEITLTVFHYMAQTTKQAGLNAIEAAFTELHPNVKFNNIYYNQGTDYFPQLSTALSSGDQPNIIMGNPGLYPDLVTEGFVMDLSDNEVIKSLNLPSGDLGDVSADGKIYGFPIDFKTWGIFYNKTIFEQNGLEVPTTLTQLNELQDKLIAAGIDPYVRSFADAVYGDIEARNTVWTRALEAGDKDVFEKLMSGEKPYVFGADEALTRAEVASALYNLAGQPKVELASFTDVPVTHQARTAIAWAAKTGIMKGVGDNKFEPDRSVSREEIATLLTRQRKLSGVDVTADKNEVSAFVDSAKISSWAVDGVAYCTKSGLVKGNPGQVFAPAGNTTRAELATIIQRIAA